MEIFGIIIIILTIINISILISKLSENHLLDLGSLFGLIGLICFALVGIIESFIR